MQKKVIVISGFSGSGKGTLIEALSQAVENVVVVKSYTTRTPRSEADQGQYVFVSEEEFNSLKAQNFFLETNAYNGRQYGTPLGDVRKLLAEERDIFIILEIDVNGYRRIKEIFPSEMVTGIFVYTDAETLKDRLLERGTESEEAVIARLKRAVEEVKYMDEYDCILKNMELQTATEKLTAIITENQMIRMPYDGEQLRRELQNTVDELEKAQVRKRYQKLGSYFRMEEKKISRKIALEVVRSVEEGVYIQIPEEFVLKFTGGVYVPLNDLGVNMYSKEQWEEIVPTLKEVLPLMRYGHKIMHYIMASVVAVEFEEQGRLFLPESFLERSGIHRQGQTKLFLAEVRDEVLGITRYMITSKLV